MRPETATATGAASALATAFLLDDVDAYEALLPGLPPMAQLLHDAGQLFRDACYWSLAIVLGRDVDDVDVVRAWEDSRDLITWQLAVTHSLDSPEVPAAVTWLGAVLTGEDWIPVHDQALHLVLAVLFTGEMFTGMPGEWPGFLLQRAVCNA